MPDNPGQQLDPLTRQQIYDRHAAGAGVAELSLEFACTERMLMRLLREEEARQAIAASRSVAWSAFTGQTLANVNKALARMAELTQHDDPRVAASAAKTVVELACKLKALEEFDVRLKALEEALGGAGAKGNAAKIVAGG